jgi:hypothetical protein
MTKEMLKQVKHDKPRCHPEFMSGSEV